MGSNDRQGPDTGIERRTLIASIGAASTIGLAGCSGSDDGDEGGGNEGGGNEGGGNEGGGNEGGDSGNLGERVPTITISYWSNLGNMTSVLESALPVVQENYQQLGLDVELRPVEYTTNITELFTDARESNMNSMYYNSEPTRLDPNAMLENFLIDRAGDTGTFNMGNWADCEMSRLILEQQQAPTVEEREQKVLEAQQRLCEEAILQPLAPFNNPAAAWNDRVDVQGTGSAGMSLQNPEFLIESEATGDDEIVVNANPSIFVNKNHHTMSGAEETPWNTLVNSPLQGYNKDLELINVLAEDISREDEGQRVVVTVKEDADFQNGDPVTAEDVDFTFRHLWENPGTFNSDPPPWDSMEVLDEKTWALNLETTYAPLSVNLAKWGIIHKESWIEYGANENPGEMDVREIIGSGPYKLVDFEREQFMRLSPRDNHPMYEGNSDIIMQGYSDVSTTTQAFRNQELDVIMGVTFDILADLEDSYGDNITTGVAEGPLPIQIINDVNHGPMMFRPFRRALGKSIDRQLINEIAFNGELYEPLSGNIFLRNHPWAADPEDVYQYTDDPSGDIEGARELLSEADWGWDDDGNLHYPEGADLSPEWPKGETPDPANYDCLNEDGNLDV